MVQMTSDIALSGVACTSGVTPRQLVQSSSENDTKLAMSILTTQIA
ncbi:NTP-binding protein [Sulfuriferula sp. AH1]